MKFAFAILVIIIATGISALADDPIIKYDYDADMAKVQLLYDDLSKQTDLIKLEISTLADAIKIIGRKPNIESEEYALWFFSVEGTEVEVSEGNGTTVNIPMTLQLRISYDQNSIVKSREFSLLDRFN
ncbi:MAG: hypothetical protein COB92_01065 [Robiginitomaculum sp.]|nr:MAG: hypothetical protein COB92_01065 [Robiginitomaculum sp.]